MIDANNTARGYVILGLVLIFIMSAVTTLIGRLHPEWELAAPILVSAIFSTVLVVTFALLWRWVITKHSDMQTTLYSVTSGFRLLLALSTMFGCYLFVGRDAMFTYVIVFMIYYLVMIGFHSIYFARIARQQ